MLLRRADHVVEALDLVGSDVVATTTLSVGDLPAFVRSHERDRPRWTWDDTARSYPDLLRAGVRVERGADLYEGMVRTGAVASRSEAKLGMSGAMYGGTRGESGRVVTRMTRSCPAAIGCVEDAARAGERGEVVRTLPAPGPVPARRGRRPLPRPPGG